MEERFWSGEYAVTEGTDATGKSSVANEIAKRAYDAGYKEVYRLDEPDSVYRYEPGTLTPEPLSPIASEIRKVIKDGSLGRVAVTNMHLFTAARAENWHAIVLPALKRGAFVSAARSYWSTYIYQGEAEGLDRQLILDTTRATMGVPYMSPDHLHFLDLQDENERAKRIENRGPLDKPDTFESRDAAFQQALLDGYRKVAAEENIRLVSAARPLEQVTDEVWGSILGNIKARTS